MAELVDAADSKSVFERSGSSSLPRGTKSEKADLKWSAFFCAEKTIQCSTFAWRQPIDLLVTDHAAMLLASGHTRRLPSLRRIKAERIAWLMAFSHSAAPLNPLPLV